MTKTLRVVLAAGLPMLFIAAVILTKRREKTA